MRRLLAVLLLLWAMPAAAETAIPVALPDGRYLAVPPPGWDGKTALPMLLYLHGYGDAPEKLLADGPLIQAMNQAGVLAILPAGSGGAWTFHGSPQRNRDDVAFLNAVVADARRRWPVDPKHVIAGGFSIGASMVWELACHSPAGFSAFLPFSGSFWLPYPDHCDGGPVDLRQVHGTDDHTFPMWGRQIGARWQQGDTRKGLEILKRLDACPTTPPVHEPAPDGLDCEVSVGCAGGKELRLCLHTGDHYVRPSWLASGLAWALKRPG